MKSVAIASTLALLSASASAFAPPAANHPITSAVKSSPTALNAVWDDYIGGQDFKGGKFYFDPLNLAETYKPLVPFFREAEIRHGRTAMLAVVGFIATDFVRLPGAAYSFETIPKTVDAHNALLQGPMYQLLLWIGLFDLVITYPSIQATMKGERMPGDFGIAGPKNDGDGKKLEKKQLSELLNGRLAMCAVGGIATQTVLTGHGFPYI